MLKEIVKFKAQDGIFLDGIISREEKGTNKLLIQIHGMTSNCFKIREKTIACAVNKIGIDTLCFNNRGSEIIKYISNGNEKELGGTAFEEIEDCYYDIVGAINYAKDLGYEEIYLQGHSLGSTKIVYTYNKLKNENNKVLANIKAIILLSLVDIPNFVKSNMKDSYLKLAEEKEKMNNIMDLMPLNTFMHPISVKNFLRYAKYNQNIDFARYNAKSDDFEILNRIQVPLFMRWGNINEIINQDAKELVIFMNNKIHNKNKDIGYIDGADHGYNEKEEILAEEIKSFLYKYI